MTSIVWGVNPATSDSPSKCSRLSVLSLLQKSTLDYFKLEKLLLYCHCTLSSEAWLYLKHYLFSANSHLVDELHTIVIYNYYAAWLRITHFVFTHKFRFYLIFFEIYKLPKKITTSHYLCHKLCCHIYLVEIPLGLPRQFESL